MLQIFRRSRLMQALLFSAVAGVLLLVFRAWWSGRFTFYFLPYNLGLAWVPLLLSLYLPQPPVPLKARIWLLLGCWLLFFPNAPYLVTDLVHLRERPGVPYLFDIVLLSFFAWNGMVAGFVSLLKVHRFLRLKLSPRLCWLLVSGVIALSSFGIYLGRYQRWNSWDIVAQPFSLLSDIFRLLLNPFSEPAAVGTTALFSVFLFAGYLTFYYLAGPAIEAAANKTVGDNDKK